MRRQPVRSRGQETVERILAVAADLLDEVGIAGLTTNLIAERSASNISSLYKFFPNKQAILAELFQRYIHERQETARRDLQDFATVDDWRGVLSGMIDRLAGMRTTQRGNRVLREAMNSTPALRKLSVESARENAIQFASMISERSGLPNDEAVLVGACVSKTITFMLDFWESPEGAKDPALLEHLKRLVHNYLADYLDPPRAARIA